MENQEVSVADALVNFLPEVKDILDLQVTGQNVLVKPFEVVLAKTASGIILEGGTNTDKLKSMVLQKGVVVNVGNKVSDIKVGMTVFFFKHAAGGRLFRQGSDVYSELGEYDIQAYLKA